MAHRMASVTSTGTRRSEFSERLRTKRAETIKPPNADEIIEQLLSVKGSDNNKHVCLALLSECLWTLFCPATGRIAIDKQVKAYTEFGRQYNLSFGVYRNCSGDLSDSVSFRAAGQPNLMTRTSSLEVFIKTHIDCTLNISSPLLYACFVCISF